MEIEEDVKNPSGLSEFFGALSKEKDDVRPKIKEKINDPKSGLSSLFQQLEEALQETKKVSVEEDLDNTRLSADDQNKLEVFSNLLNLFGSDKEIPIKVEPEEIILEELIPEELIVESEEPQDITEPQNDIITSVIHNLDDMNRKTQVKEEVEQISSIRKDFDNFRSFISQQITSLHMSGAGSGETRLEFLDDVDRATAKVDGKALVYDSGDGKWKGESILTDAITGLDIDGGTDIGAALVDADLIIVDDGAGGTNRKATLSRIKTYIGAGAADDLVAGDAAVLLTTTTGNITIDAAANNTDIIFKGTDGGSDITMLTLDGSAAGAATFNDKIVATELDISGDVDVDGTMEADAYTVDGTTLAEYIADTAGAMVSSNTETGITVTYQDSDNTLDFVIGTLNQDTTGTADNFTVSANNSTDETVYPIFVDGATGSQGAESDTGLSYNPSTGVLTTTSVTGNLTGDVTGNVSGTAATVTTAAQTNITSLGTLTTLTVDSIIINGTNIGHTSDIDALAIDSSGNVTASQNLIVSGNFTGNSQTTSDSFNLPITLNGTDGSSTNAGDNIVQDTAANANDRIVYEDATPTHFERPITWDRTT